MSNSFHNLQVWNKAMKLAGITFELVKIIPRIELFTLGDQMKRAAISIPSNIAEGKSRNTLKEFRHFLSISRGSAAELETQLLLCRQLEYLTDDQIEESINLCEEIERMLSSLMNKLPPTS